ncbi:2-keto-4-pentenoate hydratase/2-oxohepta-3-ene-1,7-dioic acid hydratase in catechol pathway [Rhodobacter aestuarii]|uniref:2-keto-4-pentenoate hydratase/2-oxohepta-3-ene-1,7-dioic acid hydratase (Catechol pathway) n=1 Tax=Rhodobacter aestuarii TaxID=453582 RepID=A0A1N7J4V1_9RHOB|nr:fumarylacetoacetate hydrolase family protein [Rhodobacter aestuarii]PTV97191.1 2-keto-4-pentenoate hydratase/2-oxohepta-3-ene-1,7-dioic acid hydratase in catechol pathway [Rhodobacter aestuarii]SIS44276.1 2-keto-4-pentenoate hydratase/2-oxohepta-3-ene-1,7-dioic acid hydratase (catechol pathway) [Rhodobacter aestuarii]
MKLVRYGDKGFEKPGLLHTDGTLRDLSRVVRDIDGAALSDAGLSRLEWVDAAMLPIVPEGVRLGAPVANVGKLIAVGLNYADHAAESGMDVPPEPVLFMKATSAISGPDDPIELPRGSTKLDWEVELAFVIGTRAKYVPLESAMDHVAGYMICNDVSERSFQIEHAGQWVKGKSHDSFAPLGPWLVTKEEVPDPQNLSLWLDVNGSRRQNGSTATMVYGVAYLVHYISQFMTLEPGDIITTGTPPGVGMGMDPPQFLWEGDTVDLGVEGLGQQHQRVVLV